MARRCSTICLPVGKDTYLRSIDSPAAFRSWLDGVFRDLPELFPQGFARGYTLKDSRRSAKRGLRLRRIRCKATGQTFSVRPCFALPYMTGWTDDVEGPLFLRGFGVPFWALARVFGRGPMYWYRLELSLGSNSIVGTTIRRAPLPEHLLADEHHQPRDGTKNYVATTVAGGCCLGAALAPSAGAEDLQAAYGGLPAGGPGCPARLPTQDGQHGRLGRHPAGVVGPVPAGRDLTLLPARLVEHPQSGQVERRLLDAIGEGVERLSRAGAKKLQPAHEEAVGVGQGAGEDGLGAGTGAEVVWAGRGVRGSLPTSRRASDEQHAGPTDASDEPILR